MLEIRCFSACVAVQRRRFDLETVVRRVDGCGSQPQTFTGGFAVEVLEGAMQACALAVWRHGRPIALVIRSGPRAELAPRDESVGPSGNRHGCPWRGLH